VALAGESAVHQLPADVQSRPLQPQLEFHDADSGVRLRYAPHYVNAVRWKLDAFLRERAEQAGAVLQYHCRVSRLALSTDGGVQLQTSSGMLTAPVVIDASGWRALARRLARGSVNEARPAPHVHAFQGIVEAELPEGSMWAVFRSSATPYYGWLVPKGGGRFLLGAGFFPGAQQTRGSQASGAEAQPWAKLEYLLEYLGSRGVSVRAIDEKPEGCPITTISSLKDLYWGAGAVFPLGEAAGLVSPSSGDGIHFGLEHAAVLARALLARGRPGLTDPAEALALRRQVRRELRSALAELRFNCLKSRVAARPVPRRIASALLPLYLRRPVERLK
jgi:flavin-dependent dehydrogenase